MSELPAGQLVAGFIAAAFVGLGVLGIVRLTRVMTVVLVVSLLGIPTAGFVAYALDPRPLSTNLDLILLAYPFVGVGLVAAIVGLAERFPRRPTQSFRSVQRSAVATVLLWGCLVAAISDLLFVFEPEFAEFNLYVNGLWLIGWLPRSTRHGISKSSFEIAATPEKVFDFIADPANWPLYAPDIELASPSGPLVTGARLTVRRRVDLRGLRGPRLTVPDSVERTAEVVSVEANRRIVSRSVDIEATVTTELEPVPSGTRVTTTNEVVVPYRLALLGARIEAWVTEGRRTAEALRSQERLKQLLEQA